jgi:hypothetical protein
LVQRPLRPEEVALNFNFSIQDSDAEDREPNAGQEPSTRVKVQEKPSTRNFLIEQKRKKTRMVPQNRRPKKGARNPIVSDLALFVVFLVSFLNELERQGVFGR